MNSPEYKCVLANKSKIVDTLNSTPGATQCLCRKYQERRWTGIYADQTAETLVDTALNRIKTDPNQVKNFLPMLRDTTGLDLIVAVLEKALAQNQQVVTPDDIREPLHNTSLAVIPENSQMDAANTELVGVSLNPSVDDMTTTMVVDKVNECKSEVKSHISRASESPPNESNARTETGSSLVPPKLQTHDGTAPPDDSHSPETYAEPDSEEPTEDVSSDETPIVQKPQSDLPTGKGTTVSERKASKDSVAVEESCDAGYNSSPVAGSDGVDCPIDPPVLVGTKPTIENLGPTHNPHTADNVRQNITAPPAQASKAQVETDQDNKTHVHVHLTPPTRGTNSERRRRYQSGQRNSYPSVSLPTAHSSPSTRSVGDFLSHMLETLKSLDGNVAFCLVSFAGVVAIAVCILIWYCLAYHSATIGVIVGLFIAKFQ